MIPLGLVQERTRAKQESQLPSASHSAGCLSSAGALLLLEDVLRCTAAAGARS